MTRLLFRTKYSSQIACVLTSHRQLREESRTERECEQEVLLHAACLTSCLLGVFIRCDSLSHLLAFSPSSLVDGQEYPTKASPPTMLPRRPFPASQCSPPAAGQAVQVSHLVHITPALARIQRTLCRTRALPVASQPRRATDKDEQLSGLGRGLQLHLCLPPTDTMG